MNATDTANEISNLATDMEHEIVTLRAENKVLRKSIETAMDIYTQDYDDTTAARLMYEGIGEALVTPSTRQESKQPETFCELCDKPPTHYDEDLGCWFCDDHKAVQCSHPVHDNPGLIAPCPECGATPWPETEKDSASTLQE